MTGGSCGTLPRGAVWPCSSPYPGLLDPHPVAAPDEALHGGRRPAGVPLAVVVEGRLPTEVLMANHAVDLALGRPGPVTVATVRPGMV